MQHLRLNVNGEYFPFGANFFGHWERVKAIATTEITDGHPLADAQLFQHQRWIFFDLAGFAEQPGSPLMAHGFGDAATHIDRQGSDFRRGLLVGRFFLR